MAFVHLHNHTVFSMLDGATRIQDMVNRAVELACPPWPLPTRYMYGVPDLALACDAVNHNTPEYKTWSHDKAFLEKDRRDELVEPDPRKPARACPVCEGHGHVGREGQHRRAQAAPGHQAHLWLRGLLYAGRDARPRPQARALP
ncbi:MAG: PHP domain-containing protein [Collinsella sp.]